MLVFGLHSSLFDFAPFYNLGLRGTPFQTGWFLETVVTELLIVFIIRTRKPIAASKPGRLLLWVAALALVFTLWLPFSPLASALGLVFANRAQVVVIILLVLAYAVSAELLKRWFFHAFAARGQPE